jgi:hypothetical protein
MRLGPIRDPFRSCHTSAVCTAIEVAVRLNAVADHLHAAVLAGGGQSVDSALEAVEGARLAPRHTYLEGFRVRHDTHKRAHFHRRGRETMSIAPC